MQTDFKKHETPDTANNILEVIAFIEGGIPKIESERNDWKEKSALKNAIMVKLSQVVKVDFKLLKI